LEFLGDAVVGFTITETLYNNYPICGKGNYPKSSRWLVSKRILGSARSLIGRYLLDWAGDGTNGGGTVFHSGNLFESGVAPFFGLRIEASKLFVRRTTQRGNRKGGSRRKYYRFKSQLQDMIQKNSRFAPVSPLSAMGPGSDKNLSSNFCRDQSIGRGQGKRETSGKLGCCRCADLYGKTPFR
jgi:ribonuclease-3